MKYFKCSEFSGRTINLGVRVPREKPSRRGDKMEWYCGQPPWTGVLTKVSGGGAHIP